jgi:hypothetical protein
VHHVVSPDPILQHVLAHLRNERTLALGELDLGYQLDQPQFFHDLYNVKFFLYLSDALSV